MRKERALVLGGAGFIGSHLVDGLLRDGYEVAAFDALVPQVHGERRPAPRHLNSEAKLIVADVRDRRALEAAVLEADVVLHHAAAVGVGQSMYDIVEYVDTNVKGTALLCEVLAHCKHRVRKVLVASSMSNYGEGRYRCAAHGLQTPGLRSPQQLKAKEWEMRCETCAQPMQPVPTDEQKPLAPASVYATTKRDQEELILNVCRAYGIPAVAFRYFNIYGPRQSLSNPYTGAAAIFASRILNGQPPLIFEDGLQSRDFTHVSDVVQANLLALRSDRADGEVLNVATGRSTSLLSLAHLLLDAMGKKGAPVPEIIQKFREGDIRHCYADISKIRSRLNYEPRIPFEEGVKDLVSWARTQQAEDRGAKAMSELDAHGLVV